MATSPAFVQLEAFHEALVDYFQALSQAVTAGSAPPDPAEYLGDIDYSDLLTMSLLGQLGGVNPPVGVSIDVVHNAEAVIREYGMSMKSKASIYEDGIADSSQEAAYYKDRGQRMGSILENLRGFV